MNPSDQSTILIVDSSTKTLSILKALTKDGNDRTVIVSSGREALERIESSDPAAIIVNMDMPGLDVAGLVNGMAKLVSAVDTPMVILRDGPFDHDRMVEAYALGAVNVFFSPIHLPGLKKTVDFLKDLYHQKRSRESMMQQLRRGVLDENRTIADLAGGIAHQFNNILNIITGNVELLKMDVPDNEFVDAFGYTIFDSVKKMTGLTDKLLAYARAGHYKPSEVDFNSTLRSHLAASDYGQGRIAIQTAFDPGNILVTGDETQMRMIVSALMKNAVEAISDTGSIQMKTRYIPNGELLERPRGIDIGPFVCLEIIDDGHGMSHEVTARIFEPFFSTKFQGRGLDMAAVHGIVSSHGGWINVTSAPGLGTTVQVYLPVVSYRKTTEFHMPEAQVDTGGTVLVIDDDESIRDLTLTMLKRLGYNAISASTGIEAVEQIRHYKHRIDLAILDIEMPDMKGTEIYPRLMEICPGLKVVVCSGYSINGPAESIIRAGAEVFMQKPFSFSELASVLQRLIERRKHKRYGVRDGHVVILGARDALPEPLVDISRGGVAVRHGGEHPVSRVWEQMSIVSGNGEFSIQGIPFQFIQKPTYHQGASAITKKNDLKNIRFGPLNPHQARQVEYFITHFTV